MKSAISVLAMILLAACASYSGTGLRPGEARIEDVERVMGAPAMRWDNPDGSAQLAYPRGPFGTHTYMATIGPDGRLREIRNVLEAGAFARIRAGMTQEEVLRALGPPDTYRSVYFQARDELAWEWRYCDDWSQAARFHVLFDATRGIVRSTMSLRETQQYPFGLYGSGWCGR